MDLIWPLNAKRKDASSGKGRGKEEEEEKESEANSRKQGAKPSQGGPLLTPVRLHWKDEGAVMHRQLYYVSHFTFYILHSTSSCHVQMSLLTNF